MAHSAAFADLSLTSFSFALQLPDGTGEEGVALHTEQQSQLRLTVSRRLQVQAVDVNVTVARSGQEGRHVFDTRSQPIKMCISTAKMCDNLKGPLLRKREFQLQNPKVSREEGGVCFQHTDDTHCCLFTPFNLPLWIHGFIIHYGM